MLKETSTPKIRAVVAAVQLQNVSDIEFESSLNELRELAKTLGYEVVGTFVQKRASFDRAAYFGVGKRKEIRRFVEGAEEDAPILEEVLDDPDPIQPELEPADPETRQVDMLLIDHDVSPSQARNLEIAVGCEVMDRTMVILEIFHRHASSRAARAQVEIARLGYMAPRLREAAKLAGGQGRQRSGTGGRGAGESQSALDKQKIRNRISELQLEIVAMEAERKIQRARRQSNQGAGGGAGIARVALVGYTNAGKSTLMRALTGSEVLVANKLFATLDTTVRTLNPETVPKVLVSDTVGFIKNLPHDLVASFKSTLEEAAESSLLLHVIDASDPGFLRQLEVTDKVLAEIGADVVPRIRVFNKIDMVGHGQEYQVAAQAAQEALLRAQYPDCVVMSAKQAADVARMHETIRSFFQKDLVEVELFLPWSDQSLRGKIFANCEVLSENADDQGAVLQVRGEATTVAGLQAQLGPRPTTDKPKKRAAKRS
ncbi:MAG: GTPase HflX [Rhodocyclaceae bacterium]|nr:GTPase HflX [Rhodocyclaceae bacterium]MCA3082136.1 GTPase HflX [Rhodocyclaceae bacterium]